MQHRRPSRPGAPPQQRRSSQVPGLRPHANTPRKSSVDGILLAAADRVVRGCRKNKKADGESTADLLADSLPTKWPPLNNPDVNETGIGGRGGRDG